MEKFEKDNHTIALNVLYTKNGLRFKAKLKLQKRSYFLMIPNGERCHYEKEIIF